MDLFPKPKGRAEWISLVLFPFKTYIVIASLFCIYFPRVATSDTIGTLITGYVICATALLLGAVIQLFGSEDWAATRTVLYVIAPVLYALLR